MKQIFKKTLSKLAESNYYSARAYYKYNLEQSSLRYSGPPVMVYQMGKVGSESVQMSLESLSLDMPIYHVHFLSEKRIAETERDRKKYFHTDKYGLLKRPWLYQFLRTKINTGMNGQKWRIISLTREPVARNLSAFFENIEFKLLDGNDQYEIKSDYYNIAPTIIHLNDLQNLTDLYFEKIIHDAPLVFFDRELKGVFNIDVFDSEFPMSRGYNIYETKYANVLLIRLENLNSCVKEAFKEFLDIDDFSLINTNTGAEKDYAPVYKKFKDSIVLPDSYIDKLYNSKYTKHFYSQDEIEKFRKKWRRED